MRSQASDALVQVRLRVCARWILAAVSVDTPMPSPIIKMTFLAGLCKLCAFIKAYSNRTHFTVLSKKQLVFIEDNI